ncbi:cytoplasmic protein, partial [Klebsiella pneumoniae]|nr:cytoplasmic protein [Klebsiella pneumoniae]
ACGARSLFGLAGGYQCERLVADRERRILQSTPEGWRVLSRETCYRPVTCAG